MEGHTRKLVLALQGCRELSSAAKASVASLENLCVLCSGLLTAYQVAVITVLLK